MAGVFRFSNAVSDIDKFIRTFRKLVSHFGDLTGDQYFDHTDAARFLASRGLASSLGAIGNEAINRSFKTNDTSRNPLYNQHKSYSEFFRMLGWYAPASQQSHFQISDFGRIVGNADLDDEDVKKLVEKCVLHIVSPNPLTKVKGGNILRPFPMLLRLMDRLDGILLRDELIIAVLACENDRGPNVLDNAESKIRSIRAKGFDFLTQSLMQVRQHNGGYHFKIINGVKERVFAPLGKDTLPNYTRLPIAFCKWLGWAEDKNLKSVYNGKNVHVLQITDYGRSLAKNLSNMPDIRYGDLSEFSDEEKVAFTAYSNLYQISVVYDCFEDYAQELSSIIETASPILTKYNITPKVTDFLYLGYQESPQNLNIAANELLEPLSE